MARLALAIPLRRTDRRRFSAEPVDQDVIDVLAERARGCGAELDVVAAGPPRAQLIETISRSASLQRQQAGYAAELARWTGRYAASRDGIDADDVVSGIGAPGDVPMRQFPRARLAQQPHSFEHEDASVLMVLASRTDDPLDVLRAGEATSAVLLAATDSGWPRRPSANRSRSPGPATGSPSTSSDPGCSPSSSSGSTRWTLALTALPPTPRRPRPRPDAGRPEPVTTLWGKIRRTGRVAEPAPPAPTDTAPGRCGDAGRFGAAPARRRRLVQRVRGGDRLGVRAGVRRRALRGPAGGLAAARRRAAGDRAWSPATWPSRCGAPSRRCRSRGWSWRWATAPATAACSPAPTAWSARSATSCRWTCEVPGCPPRPEAIVEALRTLTGR